MNRPEETLQRQVVGYLRLIPNLTFWTVPNQRGTRSGFEMGILKAMGVRAGVPDLHFILPNGRLGMIELKAGKGKPTDNQTAFIAEAIERGAYVEVCRSLDEVSQTLGRWLGPYGYKIPRVA